MSKISDNFLDNIHSQDYQQPYYHKKITHRDFFFTTNRECESLDGEWHYGIDQYDTCIRAQWYQEHYHDQENRPLPVDFDFDAWPTMTLPCCWNLQQPELFHYEGSMVYTRCFNYEKRGESRVFLKFGAVNYEAKIFLNQQYLGMHQGGSTPFMLEVTDYLQAANRLLVVVNNTRHLSRVPSDNTDWFNYGGIYRSVELIRLPETFIQNWSIQLIPNRQFQEIAVNLTVSGSNRSGVAKLDIPELNLRAIIPVKDGSGSAILQAAPELWSPENPRLYEVNLTYLKDWVNDRVGFREIRTCGTEIILNDQPLFLKGIACHEESVAHGKALTEAEIIENLQLAKEMGCNYVRLAHYPHSEKAAQFADSLGIMLWEEIPVYWAIEFDNSDTYQDAENQLTELIWRDQNRASVIIWSIGNENPDTDSRLEFMKSLALKARLLDPTRLIAAACLVDHVHLAIADRLADFLDIIGFNEYYGWYEPDFQKLVQIFQNSQPAKPVIISEFGADAQAGTPGSEGELGTEQCQLAIYRQQLATIAEIPYIKGLSPWILYDFRCPRRLNRRQNYYNTKGLLSADKSYRKPAFYELQRFYHCYAPYRRGVVKE